MRTLKSELKNHGYTLKSAAEKIGISYMTLNRKMSYQTEFKQSELIHLSDMTEIPIEEFSTLKMK